ncbi:MAG TPA: cyclopropane-fatty-acyl-phospholipid synthase family protein [Kofleriaceae bacterium]|nr:cyclopropane-fatty-acyl-phospholipid synthase family protein [Kofleriaceae bacterium]
MLEGEVAHPLIVPLPRVVPPAAQALRWLALARLRAGWSTGRLDLELPSGQWVRIGGAGRADAAARIHDDRLFLRLLLRGELGAGESFVAGEWSSDDLVGVVRAFLRASRARGLESPLTRLARWPTRARHRRAANTVDGSRRNIHAHYDLGNDFYRLFLDEDTLAYSCAYWPDGAADAVATAPPTTLAGAQRAKLDRLCDRLALSPRDHLLEIGCGWGGMAIHAAVTRGCRVTALTVSREQHDLASARVAAAGLADRVQVQYRDYRAIEGTFDKIVSIEMLEAVGYEYLPVYFAACARALVPGGRFALQSITMPDERFEAYRRSVDWMQTYVFPGSLIPSLGAIERASAPAGFAIEHAEDIGLHYAPTLRAWRERFVAALPRVRGLGFDEPFVKTWLMYLAFSEAAFAERTLRNHQLLLVRA